MYFYEWMDKLSGPRPEVIPDPWSNIDDLSNWCKARYIEYCNEQGIEPDFRLSVDRYDDELEEPDAEGSCHEEDIIMARIDDDDIEEPMFDISS